ncbi:MAG: hypothetical protein WED07_00075 [Candidatus Freyarchaeum deiterrae]
MGEYTSSTSSGTRSFTRIFCGAWEELPERENPWIIGGRKV